jgi:hypothetical protein
MGAGLSQALLTISRQRPMFGVDPFLGISYPPDFTEGIHGRLVQFGQEEKICHMPFQYCP